MDISITGAVNASRPQIQPLAAVQALRMRCDGSAAPGSREAWVASEVPVALVFNGISHAVMMATPQDLEDFALGFALSEGIIDNPGECRGIEVKQHGVGTPEAACVAEIDIAPRHFERLKLQRRTLAGRTGCGLCGVESLQALDLRAAAPMPPPAWRDAVGVAEVLRPFGVLRERQRLNANTGALHAAGWALPDGQLQDVLEDVGRHNALDKLLGRLARTGRLQEPGFVVMTSRTSYELVRKCARLNIGLLATVSAPTALALQLAREAGMHLWAQCRPPEALRYV